MDIDDTELVITAVEPGEPQTKASEMFNDELFFVGGAELGDDLEELVSLDVFQDQQSQKMEALDHEIGDLLDETQGAGVLLLVNIINELVTAPVETASGEVLLQPLLLAGLADRCFGPENVLRRFGFPAAIDEKLLYEPLLNFQLDPRWHPWLSPAAAFEYPQTELIEEGGKRATLKKIGKHIVHCKTMSMRGRFNPSSNMPVLIDAVESCVRVLSRYLWRKTGKGIKSISRKPAHVSMLRNHIEFAFDAEILSETEQAIGLGASPGWVPWLGKEIEFHCDDDRITYGSLHYS